MVTVADKSVVAVDCKPGFHLKEQQDEFNSQEGCTRVLNDLLETPPLEFGRKDFAVLNLLCAPPLSGSENLDIPKCLSTRLDRLAAYVKAKIERNLHRFSTDPEYSHCKPMWLMAHLVTIVKREFGATYNPRIRDNILAGVREHVKDSYGITSFTVCSDDDPNRRLGRCPIRCPHHCRIGTLSVTGISIGQGTIALETTILLQFISMTGFWERP